MNYKEMSDYEINRFVAMSLDGLPASHDGKDQLRYTQHYTVSGPNNEGYISTHLKGQVRWEPSCKEITSDYILFDPCNNPSDAWPIIVEGNISLSPLAHGVWRASRGLKVASIDKNPLRAAMIVYLMMQETK